MNSHPDIYKLQIQEGIVSGAVISQASTVEISRLFSFIGKLKPHVFENIKKEYFEYIEKGVKKKQPTRSIARSYNKLDIIRFFSFYLYLHKQTKKVFLCIRTLKDQYYLIPVVRHRGKTSIQTICGFLNFDKMKTISYKDYNDEYINIGTEYRTFIRNKIIKEFQIRKNVGIHSRLFVDIYTDISWSVFEIFGMCNYIKVFNILNNIIKDTNLQRILIEDIKKLFPTPEKKDIFSHADARIEIIKNYIFNFIDPLVCDLATLKYISKDYAELFEKLIEPIRHTIYLKKKSDREFNGENLFNRYKLSNIRFIVNYVRNCK